MPQDTAKLARALAFAANKHRDQRRKDATAAPYINHPIALLAVLADEAEISDIAVLCGAVLHDTIEDTDTTSEELARLFGERVVALVVEMTDDKALPKQVRKELQITHAHEASVRARAVKLADKICNLRDIAASPPAGWSLERCQEYFDWAKQVVEGLRGSWPKLEKLFDEAHALRP